MFLSRFDKNLETATSHLRLEPDFQSILLICDEINQKDVTAKNAFSAIKKKMNSPNPHSAYYALLVLESVVKNCGAPIHDEVFTKENCEMFSSFLEQTPHENVRQKMLELVQTWAYAFRNSEKYQAIKDTMTILKAKGHTFPELKEADAMFAADTAPNWADGKVCHRCRDEFTFTNRKHHCRNCGQVFCGQCTTKQCPLPKYGIEKDVRVCDGCFTQLQRPATSRPSVRGANDTDLPAEYLKSSLAQQAQTPPRRSEQELKEEEELQLALALSQSEAEEKKKQQQQQSLTNTAYRMQQQRTPSPEAPTAPKEFVQAEETNPDLAKYLNRSYWEQRKVNDSPLASPSAPSPMSTPQPQQPQQQQQQQQYHQAQQTMTIPNNMIPEKSADEKQIDEFAANMRTQVEIFVNRMKSNSSRGRSISNDSSVQTLFMTLTSLHSQQLSYIKEFDDKRMWYEQLQDKLAQIKDSRAALDVLRQEHADKLRRMAEEQERQRQIQMAQKLEIMRKKKQEYLQYQRQLALRRIQEQEREMQMRQEQQMAQYRMGQTAFPFMTGAGANAAVTTHSSPSHQLVSGGVYTPYAYNPNSPGPMSGQYNPTTGGAILSGPPSLAQVQGVAANINAVPSATSLGITTMPGMYTAGLQPPLPSGPDMRIGAGNAANMLPGQPTQQNGMLLQQTNAMVSSDNQPQSGRHLAAMPNMVPMQQQQATQQPLQHQHQHQHPQQQQQQQSHPIQQQQAVQQQIQQQPQQQQLTHVMLQHQNVMHTQPSIPTPAQMPPQIAAPVASQNLAIANAQMQAVAAAPTPPQVEPEPQTKASAPSEPETAELISFD